MGVESEEGEEEDDEQNCLYIIAPYIYDARYHVHPYILSTTVLSDFLPFLQPLCTQCTVVVCRKGLDTRCVGRVGVL